MSRVASNCCTTSAKRWVVKTHVKSSKWKVYSNVNVAYSCATLMTKASMSWGSGNWRYLWMSLRTTMTTEEMTMATWKVEAETYSSKRVSVSLLCELLAFPSRFSRLILYNVSTTNSLNIIVDYDFLECLIMEISSLSLTNPPPTTTTSSTALFTFHIAILLSLGLCARNN